MISPRRVRLEALLREIDHGEVKLISTYVDALHGELKKAREEAKYAEWERDEARWRVKLISEENLSHRKRITTLERAVYEQGKDIEACDAQIKDAERRSSTSPRSAYPHRPIYSDSISSIPPSRRPMAA